MKARVIAILLSASMPLAACAADSARPAAAQAGDARPVASDRATAQQRTEPTQNNASAGGSSAVVATVNGRDITMAQLQRPLVEAYGLNVLLQLVQLELAKQEVERVGLTVTPEEIEAERKRTMDRLFRDANARLEEQLEKALAENRKDEADRIRREIARSNELLLDQLLMQQRLSRPELDLVLQTNAHLRKLAEHQLPKFSEEDLRNRFNAEYGEKVRVQHIQCNNFQEVMLAKAELAKGMPFEEVVRRRSRNEITRAVGGELPAFSRMAGDVPEEFKNVAFGLRVNEVSEPVESGGSYHILRLVERIAPKAVKFESMRDVVEQQLQDMWVQARMVDMRQQLAQMALQTVQIRDPELARQFERKRQEQQGEISDPQQIRQDLEKQREYEMQLLAPSGEGDKPKEDGQD